MTNNKTRFFDILTLSDNNRLGDPFTPIIALIPTIFNLFNKTPLTMSDLDALFPGSGTWTVALKNHLKKHIRWKDDKLSSNIDHKMKAFIVENFRLAKCADIPVTCFQPITYADARECPECTQRFYDVIQQEKTTGGQQPSGIYPGGLFSGSNNLNSLLPLMIGGIALVLIMKSKKRK